MSTLTRSERDSRGAHADFQADGAAADAKAFGPARSVMARSAAGRTLALAAMLACTLPGLAAEPGAAGSPGSAVAQGITTAGAPGATASQVHELLVAADRWRTGADNLVVETEVQLMARDGSLEKERRYTVYVQAGHKSLVLMRSPAEAGQKMLMLGDDYWLLLPGSQRPMRITATQKLLGDASTGDIATMSWADDYTGTLVADEVCEGNKPCRHLSLQAARKGLSYQRIELWLGKAKHEPIRAELYVQSDKLAKLASFTIDRGQVGAMVLTDRLSSQKETRVRYLSRQNRQVPEAWLNPMFLARNPALE